jgi:V/A-type H+-transporting ATPase subunit E
MGLEAVIEEIRAKGTRETERIRQETQAERAAILGAAQEKAERIKLAADQDVDRQTAHIMNQEVSSANLVVKRQLLNTQKELLDSVYTTALSNIESLPGDFHREAIRSLLTRARAEIPDGIIHCSRRDHDVLRQILAGDQAFSGYTVGEPAQIEGGIIVESRDGELQIDYSYRTFLDGVWETVLKDASDILFR